MIPRRVHQFWTGPRNERLAEHAAALTRANPRWVIYRWDAYDLPPLPADLRQMWANADLYCGRPNVLRAVIARLVILARYGGVFVDLDIWPLRSFDELPDLDVWIAAHVCSPAGDISVLGATPDHPFIEEMTDQVRRFLPNSFRLHPGIEALQACARPPLLPSSTFYPATEEEKATAICWNPGAFGR